ncbi:MAG: DUF1684 domain-containing protein [Azospirillaceae bacterium]
MACRGRANKPDANAPTGFKAALPPVMKEDASAMMLEPEGTLGLWSWRRAVADLYQAVRAMPDPERAWSMWRTGRNRLFRGHPASPVRAEARAEFADLPFYPYDPDFRFVVDVEEPERPESLTIAAGPDGVVHLRAFARTRGLVPDLGGELTLYWLTGYGGGVFLPFRDATSGQDTFGGGRYLLDSVKGADLGWNDDGQVILDFNFAFSPSCAHDPQWACPLAPSGNTLPVSVTVGEKLG